LCGVSTTFGRDRSGSSAGNGSSSKTSSAAPAIRSCWSASSNASRSINAPRAVFTRYAFGASRSSCASDNASRLIVQAKMEADHGGLPKQLVERRIARAERGCPAVVGARCRDENLHTERPRELRHARTDRAQAHDPERLPLELRRQTAWPFPRSH